MKVAATGHLTLKTLTELRNYDKVTITTIIIMVGQMKRVDEMKENDTKRNRLHELERGQSLVEMAFGLIVLVYILAGIIDIGRAYFIYIALEDAAGETALYLSTNPECQNAASPGSVSPTQCLDPKNGEWRMKNANSVGLNWDEVIHKFEVPTTNVGGRVIVKLSYPYDLITPIVSQIAGDRINLSVQASQLILTKPQAE